jgi:hypothetical protein
MEIWSGCVGGKEEQRRVLDVRGCFHVEENANSKQTVKVQKYSHNDMAPVPSHG